MGFNDATSLKKRGTFFEFRPTTNDTRIVFKAFVTSFTDKYTSDWAEEKVHGRMDPIPTFSGTSRRISFSLDVVAASLEEAKSNLQKIQSIIQGLYPIYRSRPGGGPNALDMTDTPLFRVRYSNLIQDPVQNRRLLGYVPNFTFEPDFENSIFIDDDGSIYPKLINFNFELSVVHEHPLSAPLMTSFPYGASSSTSLRDFVPSTGTDPDTQSSPRGGPVVTNL